MMSNRGSCLTLTESLKSTVDTVLENTFQRFMWSLLDDKISNQDQTDVDHYGMMDSLLAFFLLMLHWSCFCYSRGSWKPYLRQTTTQTKWPSEINFQCTVVWRSENQCKQSVWCKSNDPSVGFKEKSSILYKWEVISSKQQPITEQVFEYNQEGQR